MGRRRPGKGKLDKEQMIVDRKAGMSFRAIGDKHGCSQTTAQNVCGETEKTLEPLIDKQVAINQELAHLDLQEVYTFKSEVDRKTKYSLLFDDLAANNAIKASRLLCETHQDHERLSNTILRSKEVVLGKAPDVAVQINNTQSGAPTIDEYRAARESIIGKY